jgi:hypothetical protein
MTTTTTTPASAPASKFDAFCERVSRYSFAYAVGFVAFLQLTSDGHPYLNAALFAITGVLVGQAIADAPKKPSI